MTTIPVHFAFDLEPDERMPSVENATHDNAGVSLREMQTLRHEIEDATGAPASFGWYVRMDRHVETLFGNANAIVERYAGLLEKAALAGDEIGLHIHSIEQSKSGWRANYSDADLIDETMEHSVEAYRAFFGKTCRAARMGDMWTSTRCVSKLDELGIHYDLTAESGLRPQSLDAQYPNTNSKGRRPSMMHIGQAPYQPDPKQFGKVGGHDKLGLWIMPMTSWQRRDYHNPRLWALSAYAAATSGFQNWRVGRVIHPQEDYAPLELYSALKEVFDQHTPPSLCVAARNFGAAPSIRRFLKAVCQMAKHRDIQFVAPEDYVRICQGNDKARQIAAA